ncbi:MAG TPA: hypothetical protein VK171_03930 [Fimbriimonas sp.]|nr:hypothetical protein [Fimbriimonas sp.]
MNIFSTDKFVISVFTHSEAFELAGLLRSPDVETYRWAAGLTFRAFLSKVVKGLPNAAQGLSVEDRIIETLKNSSGATLVQLKVLTGLTHATQLDELCAALHRLCEYGILTVEAVAEGASYRLAEGVDPAARPRVEPEVTLEDREAITCKRILELFSKLGGMMSKTKIWKGLRLVEVDADLALKKLVADGRLHERRMDSYTYYHLPGFEPDVVEKRKRKKKGASTEETNQTEKSPKTATGDPIPWPPSDEQLQEYREFIYSFIRENQKHREVTGLSVLQALQAKYEQTSVEQRLNLSHNALFKSPIDGLIVTGLNANGKASPEQIRLQLLTAEEIENRKQEAERREQLKREEEQRRIDKKRELEESVQVRYLEFVDFLSQFPNGISILDFRKRFPDYESDIYKAARALLQPELVPSRLAGAGMIHHLRSLWDESRDPKGPCDKYISEEDVAREKRLIEGLRRAHPEGHELL